MTRIWEKETMTLNNNEILLELKHVSFKYGKIQAVEDMNLTIRKGQIVSLIGANGAGKTTTLRGISGIEASRSGEILFEGKNIVDEKANEIVSLGISQVPEGRGVFADLTVLENLKIGGYVRQKDKAGRKETLERVFCYFPILKERQSQLAGTLSGGEQQMLAIGRALMANPRVLLLDEPSMGLAPKIVSDIFHIIRKINQDGTTILLVEQNAKMALAVADYGYVLETGHIVYEGSGENLRGNDYVRQAYLGIGERNE